MNQVSIKDFYCGKSVFVTGGKNIGYWEKMAKIIVNFFKKLCKILKFCETF